MSQTSTLLHNLSVHSLFDDSILGLYLGEASAAVSALGSTHVLAAGEVFAPSGERPLVVVLEGVMASKRDWFGPGNHFGAEQGRMMALDRPARLWQLDLASPEWSAATNERLRRALARALILADSAELAATPPVDLPDSTTLCDTDHPEIRRRAARLRRATPASTALAILQYVTPMPYRFGNWQERASATMARGIGMCTTKANLQVALMRAAGLEAGFVETPMPVSTLGQLMPDAWIALQRETVKHYFAAVKLGGRWHACDSSYDGAAFDIYLRSFTWGGKWRDPFLSEGEPYSPSFIAKHADVWDITVQPDLHEVMGKRSRFSTRHFEALNTRMDRQRGLHLREAPVSATEEVRA